MKKRILVLLSVVALMVGMLAMNVAPAFAGWESNGCRTQDSLIFAEGLPEAESVNGKRTADPFVCSTRTGSGFKFYDNRLPTIT
jgi:hypothetical protein